MIHGGRRAAGLLFLGDILVFVLSLWLTLLVRYGRLFQWETFKDHIGPFSILFALWALVFYMSGLYGKRVLLFKSSLPDAIVKTQFFNIVLAALFFFLLPGIGLAPKTNLVIYLVVSLLLIFLWRLALYPQLSIPRVRYPAVLIAEGLEANELVKEVNENKRYHLVFPIVITPAEALAHPEKLAERIREAGATIVVTDTTAPGIEPLAPQLYELSSFNEPAQFIAFQDMYEEVFDRVSLSSLHPAWFIEHVSETPIGYAVLKRTIDIIGGILMGLVTFIATPFVWIAQGFEGPGPIFIEQTRIGKKNSKLRAYKFRSMNKNEKAADVWVGESDNYITRVGSILRKTSLDEFPQFMSVLKGELSLIGPRNDIEGLGKRLADEIPFYNFRYLVTPGITGWAQINQQYEQGNISPQSIEETKMRLAYDFYYLKHRSLGLDIVIALKTIKRMFFRVSSW
ncbi:MAG: putative colanic acid biosysnthesis UDP-glucose lipid carrier transferase [Parcubacteria group bacterium]|nr:putative colanic acid biosysnthesis UDP-glucose lipid carrier transferase [Parcubacteria group bacterium]